MYSHNTQALFAQRTLDKTAAMNANISKKISVITVTYNSLDVLPNMLSSLPEPLEIIVVDNASEDKKSLEELVNNHGGMFVENEVNLGFGAACNKGAKLASGEYLLFLNPDASFESRTLEAFLKAIERYPDASAMNPRIAGDNGRPFFKRKSRILPKSKWMKRGWPDKDREVTVLSGAAFLAKASDFHEVGGFDEEIFLFHEDDDLSIELAKKCGPLMFIYDAVVCHSGGSSSIRSAEVAGLKAWHMGHSRVYVSVKHKMPFSKLHAISEAILKMMSPTNLFSKRQRVKNWNFLKGVVHASLGYKSTERLSQ